MMTTRAWPERLTLVLDGFLAVNGLAGGLWMVSHPLGWLPSDALVGTVFDDWTWPGVGLIVLNGVLPLVAAVATWQHRWFAPLLQGSVATVLLCWLAVQVPVVGYVAAFQVPLTALALGLLALNLPPVVRALRATTPPTEVAR